MAALTPNVAQIRTFLNALFPYAGGDTFINLRAFRDDKPPGEAPALFTDAVQVDDPGIVDRFVAGAANAATALEPHVFSPPIATFKLPNGAKLTNLAEGVTLSVELDANPGAGLAKLTALLGRPTLVVASGGAWHNPISGREEDKLHVHYRLAAPTRIEEEHAKLREARELATEYTGGDPTGVTIVHPFRCPGSWHRKNPDKPRLARIVDTACDPGGEIDLDSALAKLRAACPPREAARAPRGPGKPQAPIEDVVSALGAIPATEEYKLWIDIGLAVFSASGGSDEGFATWDEWSRKAKNYGGTEKAWRSFTKSPPRNIGFGTLYHHAAEADPSWRPPSWTADDALPHGSEQWLASRMIEEFGPDLRYVTAWKRWVAWTGTHWERDQGQHAHRAAAETCRKVAIEVLRKDPTAHKLAARLCSARVADAVERLARSHPNVTVTPEAFDTSPDVINTPGGIIDLPTGEVRPHDRTAYCTKLTTVDAAGVGAAHPLWSQFLKDLAENGEGIVNFLQRYAGYSLTGRTNEECFVFAHGEGNNGKGTFVETIAGVLGHYATPAAVETFLEEKGSHHPTDLAKLRGARFVYADEAAKGRRWNEQAVKKLTGGGKATARGMREDYWDFTPVLKLFVSGNDRPRIVGPDEAWRRRLLLTPFTRIVPPEKRDKDLKRKLVGEYPAILRWALDGAVEWYKRGLNPPEAVLAASSEYFADEDVFRQWFDERLSEQPDGFLYSMSAFGDWKEWAKEREIKPWSMPVFAKHMKKVGLYAAKHPDERDRRRGYKGWKLGG
jgi:P4 family phage/plasmid primase-like protien